MRERKIAYILEYLILTPPSDSVNVLSVDREWPAYAAGLRSGNTLLEINGQGNIAPAFVKRLVKLILEDESAGVILADSSCGMLKFDIY